MCWLKAKLPTDFFQCVKGRTLSLPVDAITCSVSLLCKPERVERAFLPSLVGWGSLGIVASTPIVPLRNTSLRAERSMKGGSPQSSPSGGYYLPHHLPETQACSKTSLSRNSLALAHTLPKWQPIAKDCGTLPSLSNMHLGLSPCSACKHLRNKPRSRRFYLFSSDSPFLLIVCVHWKTLLCNNQDVPVVL